MSRIHDISPSYNDLTQQVQPTVLRPIRLYCYTGPLAGSGPFNFATYSGGTGTQFFNFSPYTGGSLVMSGTTGGTRLVIHSTSSAGVGVIFTTVCGKESAKTATPHEYQQVSLMVDNFSGRIDEYNALGGPNYD